MLLSRLKNWTQTLEKAEKNIVCMEGTGRVMKSLNLEKYSLKVVPKRDLQFWEAGFQRVSHFLVYLKICLWGRVGMGL